MFSPRQLEQLSQPLIPDRAIAWYVYVNALFPTILIAQGASGENSLSIEDIRLKTEFEATKDVREYLRKWQETHVNKLDPVRGPGTTHPSTSEPWVGNMLNDSREVMDSGSDALRSTDTDHSESSHIEENEDAHDFLQPGDLVSLYS